MNKIINAIFKRKSVRVFTPQEITAEEKQLIIDSALQAPTAGNMYLYSIIDVTEQAVKDKLAILCDDQTFIAKAPLVLIFLADYQKNYELLKLSVGENVEKPQGFDLMLACSDALIAAQNTVMAAESLGIGSCYIGDVMEEHGNMTALLNLPEFTFPIAMLVYGYPTEQQISRPKPPRFKAEDMVFENSYKIKDAAAYEKMYKGQNPNYNYITAGEKLFELKYDTKFRKEGNRSVSEYLKKWE